mmetsp:Transcript_9382/g.31118  ORF Transcript_9382/g.31118 Transcript_9382/m.31118 type:complete len:190 (+) Transcript_9382:85-654(+)
MAAAAALIERIGDVDDCAHSAAARKRAQTLVKQEDPMFYGSLLMQHKGWLSSRWIERCAVVADGLLYLYESRAALRPEATYQLATCSGRIRELEDYKTDYYCFEIEANDCTGGSGARPSKLRLCAASSHEQLLWLQALTQGGVLYQEETSSGTIRSLHELSAAELLTGKERPLSQYEGQVCLVVNVASA